MAEKSNTAIIAAAVIGLIGTIAAALINSGSKTTTPPIPSNANSQSGGSFQPETKPVSQAGGAAPSETRSGTPTLPTSRGGPNEPETRKKEIQLQASPPDPSAIEVSFFRGEPPVQRQVREIEIEVDDIVRGRLDFSRSGDELSTKLTPGGHRVKARVYDVQKNQWVKTERTYELTVTGPAAFNVYAWIAPLGDGEAFISMTAK
jgi:hypothetical protein